MELEPLFAQVGECRQLFSERFGKDSKPYTPPVSQDIHSTHSHPDRSSMPALPVHVGDPAYTQQFCAQQQTLLTMVRVQACSHWSENVGFPSPCQSAVTMLVLCPNSRLAGKVTRVMGREILLLTAYFEHSVGFRSDQCQFQSLLDV